MKSKRKKFKTLDKVLMIGVVLAFIFSISAKAIPTIKSIFEQENTVKAEKTEQKPVELKKLAEFKDATSEIRYLGQIAASSETNIVAGTNGTITKLNFDLGDEVEIGDELLKIEEVRNAGAYKDSSLSSTQLRQAELGLEQAKQSTESAEKAYKNLKKSTESDLKYLKISKKQAEADGDTDKVELLKQQIKSLERNLNSQLRGAKTQKEIAQLQEKSAGLTIKSLRESALPVSTIDGVVTSKKVEEGENVSLGQTIMTIADKNDLKITFYASEDDLVSLTKGLEIKVKANNQKEVAAKITAIAPFAENSSRRFLIEAEPILAMEVFIPGTVAEVVIPKKNTLGENNIFLLPLSVITVDQNENYVFTEENGLAKKVVLSIEEIEGEKAKVKIDLSPDSFIVTEGNKFLNEGDEIKK